MASKATKGEAARPGKEAAPPSEARVEKRRKTKKGQPSEPKLPKGAPGTGGKGGGLH